MNVTRNNIGVTPNRQQSFGILKIDSPVSKKSMIDFFEKAKSQGHNREVKELLEHIEAFKKNKLVDIFVTRFDEEGFNLTNNIDRDSKTVSEEWYFTNRLETLENWLGWADNVVTKMKKGALESFDEIVQGKPKPSSSSSSSSSGRSSSSISSSSSSSSSSVPWDKGCGKGFGNPPRDATYFYPGSCPSLCRED